MSTFRQLNSVQYLRAIAAFGVLAYHASISLLDTVARIPLWIGLGGVDLFFVISGFIMAWTTYDEPLPPQEFFRRRLIRVVPLYFILTTVFFAMVRVFPSRSTSASVVAYAQSILFIPFYNDKVHLVSPVLGQGWTLNFEMFFYVIFAVALALPRRVRLIAVVLCLGTCALAGAVFHFTNAVAVTYTSPLLLEFCFGIGIASVALRFRDGRLPHLPAMLVAAWVVVLSLAASMYWFTGSMVDHRVIEIGLPSAMLLLTAVWAEMSGVQFKSPTILLLGAASYSLYLMDGFTLAFMRRAWTHTFEIQSLLSHAGFICVSLALGGIVGIAIHKGVERPITKLFSRKRHHSQPSNEVLNKLAL
ncbi:MAG: acyltransferase [Rhizomicrobium sp.]